MRNYIKILLLSILPVVLLTTGCEDDDEFATVSISSLNETSAYTLDAVIITGTNLNTVNQVFVGKTQAEFTTDGSSIIVTVPQNANIGETFITLVIASSYRVVTTFEVLLRPNPVIETISSTAVGEGGQLKIKGLSFNSEYNPTVKIGEIDATITANTETKLTVTVPAGLEPYQLAGIEVTTIHGTATYDLQFYAGDNLMVNGELESGSGDNFANWEKWNGGDGMTETAAAASYFGRSMNVVGAGSDQWRTQFASAPIDMDVGQEYIVIVTAKAESVAASMRISTNPSALYTANKDIPNTWTQLVWSFTANEPSAEVVLDMGGSSNPFVIDNITVIPGESVAIATDYWLANWDNDPLYSFPIQRMTSEAWDGADNATFEIVDSGAGRGKYRNTTAVCNGESPRYYFRGDQTDNANPAPNRFLLETASSEGVYLEFDISYNELPSAVFNSDGKSVDLKVFLFAADQARGYGYSTMVTVDFTGPETWETVRVNTNEMGKEESSGGLFITAIPELSNRFEPNNCRIISVIFAGAVNNDATNGQIIDVNFDNLKFVMEE